MPDSWDGSTRQKVDLDAPVSLAAGSLASLPVYLFLTGIWEIFLMAFFFSSIPRAAMQNVSNME